VSDARALRDAADVAQRARALWGAEPTRPGVVHVTAVAHSPEGALSALVIHEHSPKSPHDAFALSVARASADAIVITGKLLRDEPTLRYELDVLGVPRAPLLAYRQSLGRSGPPHLYILTSGRGLDPEHPALRSWPEPTLWLPAEEAALPDALGGVRRVRREAPSLRKLVMELRERGYARVLVEAGPSTAGALYDSPLLVDELLLSVFEGDARPQLAGALPAQALELEPVAAPTHLEEPSGSWSFQMRRRPGTTDPT